MTFWPAGGATAKSRMVTKYITINRGKAIKDFTEFNSNMCNSCAGFSLNNSKSEIYGGAFMNLLIIC